MTLVTDMAALPSDVRKACGLPKFVERKKRATPSCGRSPNMNSGSERQSLSAHRAAKPRVIQRWRSC